MKNFITINDPELAKQLSTLGFLYVKNGDAFAFHYDDKLMKILKGKYANVPFCEEAKLRF